MNELENLTIILRKISFTKNKLVTRLLLITINLGFGMRYNSVQILPIHKMGIQSWIHC